MVGVAVIAGGLVLLDTPRDVEVVAERFVTPQGPEGLITANNSPVVARNPHDADNVVVAHRIDQPRFSALLHHSADGGRTWQATELPLPAGTDRAYAPDVAFGPDGVLYVVYVNLAGPANVPEQLWLGRSQDGGRSLSDPVRVAGELSFQPRVAVDRDGVVHVTFLQADEVALYRLVGAAQIMAVRSVDGGETFAEPVAVSDPDRPRVGAATPAVTSSGDLVVLYRDFKDNVRDFEALEGPAWPEPSALVLTRSDDAGQSFSPGEEIDAEVVATGRFLVFLPPYPSLAAGPDGTLAVAWADGRDGEATVLVRASDDGGRSWSRPVPVDAERDGTAQLLPQAAFAATGRLDVVYLERLADAEAATGARLATSRDGGASFTSVAVSEATFDARIGPRFAPFLEPDIGSRLGLVSWDRGALAAWTDTRLGDAATGRQDIVAARVETTPATWHPAPPAVAAALLAVVAIAVGSMWLTGRRRPEPLGYPDRHDHGEDAGE